MRASILTELRRPLSITTVADPECPPDGVVLRVLASGICRSDWHVWSGGEALALPQIPGHEYCGEVLAAGRDVRRWRAGDRVIAPFILACGACPDCAAGNQTICETQLCPGFGVPGSFAEQLAVARADHNLTRLPDGLDPALAAALGCRVTTAWHALTGRAALRPGEWLAVFGTGGIGLSAMLLAKALGARVAVVDIVAEKLTHARALGADAAIDASAGDAAEAIRQVTGGGAHVAIEALGITDTALGAVNSLRKLGRMVQVGLPTGPHVTMPMPMETVYHRQLALFGTRGMPSWRYPSLLEFIAATGLDLSPLVNRRVSLSQVSDELAAFDRPAPPGISVITDFTG